ncbi:MAG: hypothetical protein ACM3OB_02145 [Acidobacteriota bacterium]
MSVAVAADPRDARPAGGWPLWRRQTAAVVSIEVRKNLLRGGSLLVLLMAVAPAAFLALRWAIVVVARREETTAVETAVLAQVFQIFLLRTAMFFGCVGIFTHLFRGEILQRSLHYYFLAPMRREVLLLAKYLAGVVLAWTAFLPATLGSLVVVYLPSGAAGREYLLHGPGLGQAVAYLGVAALGCVGYGAVFLLMGLWARNPLLPAAALLGWEWLNFLLPPALKRLSVIHYLQSLCPVPVDQGPLALPAEATSAPVAILGLLLLAALLLVLAMRRVRRLELVYGED